MMIFYRVNSPRVVHEVIDGETVMIDFESGAYFNINQVGTAILERLESGLSLPDVAHEMQKYYGKDIEAVKEATEQFIKLLEAEEILVAHSTKHQTSTSSSINKSILPEVFIEPHLDRYDDMQNLLLLDPIHDVSSETGWPLAHSKS